MCRVCFDIIRAVNPEKILLVKLMPTRSSNLIGEGCCKIYFKDRIMKLFMMTPEAFYPFWFKGKPIPSELDMLSDQFYYSVKGTFFKEWTQVEKETCCDLTHLLHEIKFSPNYEAYTYTTTSSKLKKD